jgi:hypothetical protein
MSAHRWKDLACEACKAPRNSFHEGRTCFEAAQPGAKPKAAKPPKRPAPSRAGFDPDAIWPD